MAPMEIHELTEISRKIYSNIQELVPQDIKTIEEILDKKSIKYGKIRTFDLEDSQTIILLTLKQNCLILIKYLLENGIDLPNKLLDLSAKLLYLKEEMKQADIKRADLHAQIEIERILEAIESLIIDIIFMSKYSGQTLIDFLKSKRIPDTASMNLAISFDFELELSSFELSVLNKKLIGPVLLGLIRSYKHNLRKCAKNKILTEIKPYIFDKDKSLVYEIFYLINTDKHKDLLLKIKPEKSNEYFGFMSSLIVDKESADISFSKLEPFFDEFESALKALLNFAKTESKMIHPKDEKIIICILECINKLVDYKIINFYRYISLFQGVLKIKVCKEIKGLIYEILCKYITEKDVFIEKIIECRDEVEKEIKSKSFYLLPRLIRFINMYKKRELKEIELLRIGVSVGSPYISYIDKSLLSNDKNLECSIDVQKNLGSRDKMEFRSLGFKSEDPSTIIECFDAYISSDIIKLNSSHIRAAMMKDTRVTEKIIQFQIEHKMGIDDIAIINSILCYPSHQFFEYVRLFKDFSFYLNGDFLERLSDDLAEGMKWIKDAYSRELGVFILRNSGYFNDIIKRNIKYQAELVPIYEKNLDENLGEIEFSIFDESCLENENFFMLYDDQELLSEGFFRIFAKQLIYQKFYLGNNEYKNALKSQYLSKNYEIYVKAKTVCGQDVSRDLDFLKSNLIISDDLLGYLKIVGSYDRKETAIGASILLNFGIKDSSYVLKNFESASDFERFIMFFSIDEMSKELEIIIKNHIMRNLKNSNEVYLKMCLLQLFKCKDLDQIIKILEKNYHDKEFMLRLCIHNISNGGKYFPKHLIDYADDKLKSKALFMIYYLDIWDKEYILGLVNKMDPEISDEMKYLFDDIKYCS